MGSTVSTNLKQAYHTDGYVIARQVLDPVPADEMVHHVEWLCGKHPDTPPERLGHGLLVDDPFMWRLAGDDRILDMASQFIGNNIALFAAHYIAKPPRTGKAVQWHQDGSYWPLEPMDVVTLWVAATPSTVENGCMRVLPGTQNSTLIAKSDLEDLDRDKFVLGRGMRSEDIDDSQAIDIELDAGDVSIHNPNIIHGSNANSSDKWRIGLTLRYVPTTTLVKKDDHENMLLRGKPAPGVANAYARRPTYVDGKHMSFLGCEEWK